MYNAECFLLPQWLSKLHVLCLFDKLFSHAVFLFIFIDRVGYIQMERNAQCPHLWSEYYRWWEKSMQMKLTKSIQLELIPQLGRKKKKKTNNKSPKLILIVKTLDKIQILIPKPHNAISAESHFSVKPHFQPCRKIIHLIAFCNNTRDILWWS